MSLAIVFKGPEGIVLAADSRVTLSYTIPVPPAAKGAAAQQKIMSAFYDNATKLLKVNGHDYVASVTYGMGALGQKEPRTAHSFLPEFENEVAGGKRLSVEDFAKKLREFFMNQWNAAGMPAGADPMVFIVAGYNENEPYGRVYRVAVPIDAAPVEQNEKIFGLTWGGQGEITSRIINSIDPKTLAHLQTKLTIPDDKWNEVVKEAKGLYGLKIPYQFLPLQDCVDLAILLIRTTAQLMRYMTDLRGVGGAIDVASITRTEGFSYVQTKKIRGEPYAE